MADDSMALGYALGQDSNNNGNCNSGFFGGDGWWAIILFAMIFGWGNGGWGGNGGGINSPAGQGALTRADLCSEFNFNNLDNAVRGVQQGICDSTYALNNAITSGFNNTNVAMLQGFNGVDKSMCQLGYNLQDCCCQTQRAIDGVNYNMATNACAIQNTIQNTTRDILESNNANTRAILDFLTQSKIDGLQSELSAAQAQLSQANQTNNLINALRPCPVPAYLACNPWANQAAYGSCGSYSGCGC